MRQLQSYSATACLQSSWKTWLAIAWIWTQYSVIHFDSPAKYIIEDVVSSDFFSSYNLSAYVLLILGTGLAQNFKIFPSS